MLNRPRGEPIADPSSFNPLRTHLETERSKRRTRYRRYFHANVIKERLRHREFRRRMKSRISVYWKDKYKNDPYRRAQIKNAVVIQDFKQKKDKTRSKFRYPKNLRSSEAVNAANRRVRDYKKAMREIKALF